MNQYYDIQELIEKGWRVWNNQPDDRGLVLVLCPLTEFNKIPVGTELESLIGKKVIKGIDYIDTDTRGNLLAYGVRA